MQRYLAGDSSVYHEIRDVLSYDAPMPWQILAITFTNKAANELKERLVKMLGDNAADIWACTFHSACLRILRKTVTNSVFHLILQSMTLTTASA